MVVLFLACLTGSPGASVAADAPLSPDRFEGVGEIVQAEIASGRVPGAVVLIGQGDAVLYRQAFGWRMTGVMPAPMTADTLFDLASLTKVVATTTAIMQLAERGTIDLDAPVSTYWRRFGANEKAAITVRELLTHRSGLKPDLDLRRPWSGYAAGMRLLTAERPVSAPGARYIYSDENFLALGELVRRASGLPLDVYCGRNIFGPLRMAVTGFRPAVAGSGRIAPTGARLTDARAVPVNDPTAERMGGVAGHAGLFSTADDLARFARMLLGGGALDGTRVLAPASIDAMTAPQAPGTSGRWRGLGWEVVDGPGDDGRFLPGSFGHTGYTGTMIWLERSSGVYVIILTNRTYPDGRGDAQPLRDAVLRLVTASVTQNRTH